MYDYILNENTQFNNQQSKSCAVYLKDISYQPKQYIGVNKDVHLTVILTTTFINIAKGQIRMYNFLYTTDNL